jgi:hypothetical protein
MRAVGKPALHCERNDRDIGQGRLPQQFPEKLDAQPQDMPLECRLAIGENAMEGSL